ncbi:MAG: Fe/S biogenesis protein NfuA [Chloroflexi bacterium]|nr:MAG: Fe/S biogenesis protein NfuA [Chloroflexota bacterium]
MTDATGEIKLAFSEAAVSALSAAIAGYPETVVGLRLKIVGRGGQGFDHVITLVEQGAEPDDTTVDANGFHVFVERENADKLNGVAIHYEYKGPEASGLEFDNPNSVWDNPLEERVQILFDEYVNPGIASHGGVVTLLAVEGDKAYIEMGGGCAGCGMANVTLKQGIEVAVKEHIPEIVEVVDTTDHAAGTNPYYQPQKEGAASK